MPAVALKSRGPPLRAGLWSCCQPWAHGAPQHDRIFIAHSAHGVQISGRRRPPWVKDAAACRLRRFRAFRSLRPCRPQRSGAIDLRGTVGACMAVLKSLYSRAEADIFSRARPFVLRTLKRCYMRENILASRKTRFLKSCYARAKKIVKSIVSHVLPLGGSVRWQSLVC